VAGVRARRTLSYTFIETVAAIRIYDVIRRGWSVFLSASS